MKVRAIIASLFTLCFLTTARAAEIRLEYGCTLVIEGQIDKGDDAIFYEKVLEGSNSCASFFEVHIGSAGGDLGAAIGIGKQVRALHVPTHAPYSQKCVRPLRDHDNCLCASACFFIWAAGSTRTGHRVYVHRPRLDPKVYVDLPERQPTFTLA